MYIDVHWRTAFIWNTSRKSYIKYVTATRKIFLHMKKKKQCSGRNRMTEEEKAEDLWQVEGWERASVSGNEKQKKSSADSQKRKTNKIWKPVAGFGAALVLLLGITAGMAGGYIQE